MDPSTKQLAEHDPSDDLTLPFQTHSTANGAHTYLPPRFCSKALACESLPLGVEPEWVGHVFAEGLEQRCRQVSIVHAVVR